MDCRLAPQVTADILDGARAYLLGWARMPVSEGGGWGARIAWIEPTEEGARITRGGLVDAREVHDIEGEDYSHVPRDGRPRDDTDPRDPGYQHRQRERIRDHPLGDGDEPNF